MTERQHFLEAVQAARRGDREGARKLMRQAILDDPSYAPAWLWMGGLVDDLKQRRDCLERALALDPNMTAAREGLEIIRLQETLQEISLLTPRPVVPTEHSKGQIRKLGAYLVERGFITNTQLEAALVEQRNSQNYRGERLPLGDVLIQRGWLTPQVLGSALVMQQQDKFSANNGQPPSRLGEYLVVEGIISAEQLAAVLAEQSRRRHAGEATLLGDLLVRAGYLTFDALEKVLQQQRDDFFSRFGD
jgi:hypothetical protein